MKPALYVAVLVQYGFCTSWSSSWSQMFFRNIKSRQFSSWSKENLKKSWNVIWCLLVENPAECRWTRLECFNFKDSWLVLQRLKSGPCWIIFLSCKGCSIRKGRRIDFSLDKVFQLVSVLITESSGWPRLRSAAYRLTTPLCAVSSRTRPRDPLYHQTLSRNISTPLYGRLFWQLPWQQHLNVFMWDFKKEMSLKLKMRNKTFHFIEDFFFFFLHKNPAFNLLDLEKWSS